MEDEAEANFIDMDLSETQERDTKDAQKNVPEKIRQERFDTQMRGSLSSRAELHLA